MSTTFAIRTIIEIIIAVLLIIGFMNEEKVIRFENELFRIVKITIKRAIKHVKGVN